MTITPELLDRLPPRGAQAERAVIGACLLDPRQLEAIAPIVRPEDFYADANQILFRHLLTLDCVDAVSRRLRANRRAGVHRRGDALDAGFGSR